MQETVIIHGDEAAIKHFQQELQSLEPNQVHITQRKNLDGNTDTWIAIATLAIKSLPTVFDLVIKIIEHGKKVKKVKIGSTEINNPTRQDLEKFKSEE